MVHAPEAQTHPYGISHLERLCRDARAFARYPFPELAQLFHCRADPGIGLSDVVLALEARAFSRLEDLALFRAFARHRVVELAVEARRLRILEAFTDQRRHEARVDRDVLLEEADAAEVVDVAVGQQHAVHVLDVAVHRVILVAAENVGIVGAKVGAVEAVERREETHTQVVAQAEGGASRFDELFEELAGLAEAGAEVEEPAALRPFEEDTVAADFAGTTVQSDSNRSLHGDNVRAS